MGPEREIKTTLAIDGETAFKASISESTRALKLMASELKLNTAEFNLNGASMENLTKRRDILNREIEQEKEHIRALTQAVEDSTKRYGASHENTDKYRESLIKSQTALSSMEKELEDNGAAIDKLGKKTVNFDEILKNVANTMKNGIVAAAKATAVAVGTVAAAAGAAAVKLGKEVVASFGELEQNLGGSEAVFGKYAASIQKTGEDAYKNLGVSQSQYLATANKMGALFQGSGIEQKKSMDLTTQAMQRAADMASVMGIDMQVALDSVAGAAKGNFTMMDNLGVAMNATTIQAYAMSKGLISAEVDTSKLANAQDKASLASLNLKMAEEKYNAAVEKNGENSTQAQQAAINLEKAQVSLSAANRKVEETMNSAGASASAWWQNASQSEKAEVAMQMFFENTQQYAGNFAREAEQTISGSIGMLKASVSSFVAGLGNSNADMTNLTQNLVSSFQAVVTNITPVLQNIITALPTAISTIVENIGGLLPMFLDTVTDMFSQVLSMLVSLLPSLIPVAAEAMVTITNAVIDNLPLIVSAAMQLMTDFIGGIESILPQLLPAAVSAITLFAKGITQMLPQIMKAGIKVALDLISGVSASLPELIPAAVEGVMAMIKGIIGALPQIIKTGIEMVVALVKGLVDSIPKIIDAIPSLIQSIVTTVTTNLPVIIKAGIEITIALIAGLIKAIPQLIASMPQIIAGVVNGLLAGLGSIWDVGKSLVQGLWEGIKNTTTWLWNKLKGWINDALGWIADLLGIHSPSRKMRDMIGKPMVQGVAVGIEKNAGLVNDAMKDLMPDASATSVMLDVNRRFHDIGRGVVSYRAKEQTTVTLSDSAVVQIVNGFKEAFSEQGDAVMVVNEREMARWVRKVVHAH